MANKFAIYAGFTNVIIPPIRYYNISDTNLVKYTKTIKEAEEIFETQTAGINKWVQLVCLTSLNIIKSSKSYDISQSVDTGYHSDEYYN